MKPTDLPYWLIWFISKTMNIVWFCWSQIVNSYLWLTKYRGSWCASGFVLTQIQERLSVGTFEELPDKIRNELKTFRWQKDKFLDWYPWLHTLAAEGFIDDCDGASRFGKYLFKCVGFPSKRVKLLSMNETWNPLKWYAHIIRVSEDSTGKNYFISNNDLVKIQNPENWKEEIKKYFRDNNLQFYDWII